MTDSIDNTQDIIDSRDVIARIEELESNRESILEYIEEGEETQESLDQWDEDEGQELEALRELAEEAENYAPDWQHGEALIRDSYFEEYAEELARDIYGSDIDSGKWPFYCIDWDRAARDLKQDFTCVDFDGVEYWIR